jgi:hypothetical protein
VCVRARYCVERSASLTIDNHQNPIVTLCKWRCSVLFKQRTWTMTFS